MYPTKLIAICKLVLAAALAAAFAAGCVESVADVEIEQVYQNDNGRIIVNTGQENTGKHFHKEKVFIRKGCFKCKKVEYTVMSCNANEDNWNEASKDCVTLIPHVQEEGKFYLVFMEGAFTGSQIVEELPIFNDSTNGESAAIVENRSGTSDGVLFIYEVDFNE